MNLWIWGITDINFLSEFILLFLTFIPIKCGSVVYLSLIVMIFIHLVVFDHVLVSLFLLALELDCSIMSVYLFQSYTLYCSQAMCMIHGGL